MDNIKWWQSRTIWSALVAAICGVLAITGHSVDAGAQTDLVNGLVELANGIGVVAGVAAAYYRSKATTTVAPKG